MLKPALRRVAVASLMVAGALSLSSQSVLSAAGPIIHIDDGAVQGRVNGNVVEYLGIPYAAPPVGELRWMPPKAPAAWSDTRDATAFGPACGQVNLLGVFAGPVNYNEDCLYLNVIKPASAPDDGNLPVLFWIHGGGFLDGAASDYDASKLANDGNIVVVTINYRLGPFGFFSHPALNNEGHLAINYGLLDQQFALKWVHDNIAEFGGNPDDITLSGQSAGGASVAFNIISPLSRDMVSKAIIQSSASYLTTIPLSVAEQKGIAFSKAANCGDGDDAATAACLRRLPAEDLLKLFEPEETFGPYWITPVADGKILPKGGADAFASGDFARIPIMNGSTEDEGSFFAAIPVYFSGKAITNDDIEAYVNRTFGGDAYPAGTAHKVLDTYKEADFTTPQRRMVAIQSDVMVCRIQHGTHLLAGKVPLYAYEFRDRSAPPMFPELPEFEQLAYHTADLQYLFPGFHGGDKGERHDLSPSQQSLSDDLVKGWTNFVKTGNPNGEGETVWPAYTGKDDGRNILAQELTGMRAMEDDAFTQEHKCGFWSGILTY